MLYGLSAHEFVKASAQLHEFVEGSFFGYAAVFYQDYPVAVSYR